MPLKPTFASPCFEWRALTLALSPSGPYLRALPAQVGQADVGVSLVPRRRSSIPVYHCTCENHLHIRSVLQYLVLVVDLT
jgi:hypothetical protein